MVRHGHSPLIRPSGRMSQDSKFLCLMYPSPFVGWAWICGDGSDSNPDREEVAKLIDTSYRLWPPREFIAQLETQGAS
jgi:hypothetical protein